MPRRLIADIIEDSTLGPDECWPWQGAIEPHGYGLFHGNLEAKRGYAHRFMYERLVGPIPDGMVIDHLCHTNDPDCFAGDDCEHRRCVNPTHMEIVPRGENSRRAHRPLSDQCSAGHEYVEGSYIVSGGARVCLVCRRVRDKTRRPAQRAQWTDDACPKGHPVTDDSIVYEKDGARKCRTCVNENSKHRRAQWSDEKRAAANQYLKDWRERQRQETSEAA